MMTDPFGNYLFQKILEKVSEGERTHILSHVQVQISPTLAYVIHSSTSRPKESDDRILRCRM